MGREIEVSHFAQKRILIETNIYTENFDFNKLAYS